LKGRAANLLAHLGAAQWSLRAAKKGMSIFEEIVAAPLDDSRATSFESDVCACRAKPGSSAGATGRQVFDVNGSGDTVPDVLAAAVAAALPLPDAAIPCKYSPQELSVGKLERRASARRN